MASRKFTKEEMDHLRASAYVLDASPSIVHFPAEFKEKFRALPQEGKKPNEAVKELGIDSGMLGENRVGGLKGMMRNEVRGWKGFRDLDAHAAFCRDCAGPEARAKHLESQTACKGQDMEFLKLHL
ncbi:MAG: hypothetical protein LBU32_14685 [Clostridiales bacterium]|jgi:hypothetical protein|nr:hypothetical protein [Clostridiales bacterium]